MPGRYCHTSIHVYSIYGHNINNLNSYLILDTPFKIMSACLDLWNNFQPYPFKHQQIGTISSHSAKYPFLFPVVSMTPNIHIRKHTRNDFILTQSILTIQTAQKKISLTTTTATITVVPRFGRARGVEVQLLALWTCFPSVWYSEGGQSQFKSRRFWSRPTFH